MMQNYLLNLKEQTIGGLKEFSLNDSLNSTKGFLKDYWDLGFAVLGGYIINDHDLKSIDRILYSSLSVSISLVGAVVTEEGIAGLFLSEPDSSGGTRLIRNFGGGLTSLFYFNTNFEKSSITTNDLISMFFGCLTLGTNRQLKKEKFKKRIYKI